MELVAHRLQQLKHSEARIEYVGHRAVGRHLLQEVPAQRGFAGTNVAAEHHHAATGVVLHTIKQVRQCLAVARAHVDALWVGCDGKRWLAQAEVGGVHGLSITVLA